MDLPLIPLMSLLKQRNKNNIYKNTRKCLLTVIDAITFLGHAVSLSAFEETMEGFCEILISSP